MTSKEYWTEFDKTLNSGDKDFLKTNKEDINRMVRQYGRGYIEEIITIRKITNNKQIMNKIHMYVCDVMTHIVNMIILYIEHKNLTNDIFNKVLLPSYHVESLYKYGKDIKFDDNTITALKTNINSFSLQELMSMIEVFKSDIHIKIPDFLPYVLFHYKNINHASKQQLKNKIHLFYGFSFDTLLAEKILNTDLNMDLLTLNYYLSCYVNKKMVSKKDIGAKCTSGIPNKNLQETYILHKNLTYEMENRYNYDIGLNGRSGTIPDINDKYYKYPMKYNKTYIAGHSGTSTVLIPILLMFDMSEKYNNEQSILYSIFAVLIHVVPYHHSIYEVLISCAMLKLIVGKNTTYIKIFDYIPPYNYEQIIKYI